MPKHKINWVNDHIEICDRLDARVQLMQDYLDGKPKDFDGIDVKRFLLGQAREQVSWYRQVDRRTRFCGMCHLPSRFGNRTALFGALSAGVQLPGHRAGYGVSDAILRSRSCPNSGPDTTPKRGLTMLVKLQTHQYLIYAELNKTERVTHLAS